MNDNPMSDMLEKRIRTQIREYPEALIRQRLAEYRARTLVWGKRDTPILQGCIRILEGELRKRGLAINPPVNDTVDAILKELEI